MFVIQRTNVTNNNCNKIPQNLEILRDNLTHGANMDNTIYTSYLSKVTMNNAIKSPFADIVSNIQSEQYAKEISEIRNEPNEHEQKRLKRENLPVFFPTLIFGSHYALDDETDANGIVQFDVDVKENVNLDFKELRSELQAIPELFYL